MMLRPSRIEKDGLELAQLPRDLSHLAGAEAARVGKDAQAVAPIGRRSEHIDELELHHNDATPVPAVRSCSADAGNFSEARRWPKRKLALIVADR
jgi:hypothetical protein